MKQCLLVLLLVVLFVSCKTKTIHVPIETIKTEYKDKYLRDSIYLQDSIYVDRWMSGDTIYLTKERFKYLYKDKFVRDTITLYEVKEISYPVVETKEVNKLKQWQIVLMVLGGVLIGYVGYRIYRFIK